MIMDFFWRRHKKRVEQRDLKIGQLERKIRKLECAVEVSDKRLSDVIRNRSIEREQFIELISEMDRRHRSSMPSEYFFARRDGDCHGRDGDCHD